MTDFVELNLPDLDRYGNINKWFVTAIGKGGFYLTTDGKSIDKCRANNDHLYFDTEWKAFEASLQYYTNRGMMYPHREEYNKLISGGATSLDNDVVESQAMEFE